MLNSRNICYILNKLFTICNIYFLNSTYFILINLREQYFRVSFAVEYICANVTKGLFMRIFYFLVLWGSLIPLWNFENI